MGSHKDIKGRSYTPAPPGDTLCRTCMNKEKDCTWPGRSVVICMNYDKEDPDQLTIIDGPRGPEELFLLAQEQKERDSIMQDSIR